MGILRRLFGDSKASDDAASSDRFDGLDGIAQLLLKHGLPALDKQLHLSDLVGEADWLAVGVGQSERSRARRQGRCRRPKIRHGPRAGGAHPRPATARREHHRRGAGVDRFRADPGGRVLPWAI